MDHVRRANREAQNVALVAQGEASDDPSLETEERLELCQLALRHMADLPEQQRLVLHLKYLEEKTNGEIAFILGTQVGTVRKQCVLALRRLNALLSRRGHQNGHAV